MIKGTIKADGMKVGSIEIDLIHEPNTMKCKAAFVNTKDGTTTGWTTGLTALWSDETKKKVFELAESMERDLAKIHFSSWESDTTGSASGLKLSEPGGIAEHVGSKDADQV